jgi:glycosyltransferase involved in cell wall biosynthesis
MNSSSLIIIPAFNEADRIGAVVADVRSVLPAATVLVVDDGSSDETAAVAAAAGALVLRLRLNCGYGVALQAGYKYAARNQFALVAQLDADGQHTAEYLPEMLSLVEAGGADLVVGSRFLDGDGHYTPSLARKVGLELFGRVA